MADCCENKSCAIDALRVRQSSTLKVVLCINVVMFLVEIVAGIMSGSTALLSDSLDNLGDAITYGLSLYAIASAPRSKAKIALFKGILILIAGLFVFSQVVYRIIVPIVPIYETMGLISLLALLANGTCLALLWKHHEEDINMSSVWECSRNDVASNISVFVAAGGVWLTHSGWPDILVGLLLALLFLKSSVKVIRGAVSELRNL
ncbi:cation diffusion facilitator family transporter [Methylotenera sp.]|uniref:cation diffusion facilitator family transporter n=1 Tax=Methylotenera sp. TaxID=2051956 RepID=UPI00271CA901|nr:cation diffusion facilitator family transporter [Methylotenera sp.]MDO9392559.1 cation diffusion facilitator family transporter [Methylotenera sp.]MDP1522298.1 cation diffusion facilitator family transporter [Methylotenera sp.]MDP1660258.1 cation diffusion facilitator family transporter [Methylotenera sp.]MDP2071086.1 cation diffusion facilitator family transporter [Methylotenera sp.]MDP3005960.1 cation diffusion facilitator family transporter [Methylotenera sp.]